MTVAFEFGGLSARHAYLGGEKIIREQALTALLEVGPIPSSSKGFSKGSSKDPIRGRVR
ncbi:MAG TPA: hypothetical protein PKZ76_06065 [Xanthomonadaceae bacterium]|nr:hypothetical protein [Xanthomonadaceae bacterium]